MSNQEYSKCCLSSVRLYSGEEGTNHYICNACDEACDVTDSQVSKQDTVDEKIKNDISLVAYHLHYRELSEGAQETVDDIARYVKALPQHYLKEALEVIQSVPISEHDRSELRTMFTERWGKK